MSSSLVLLPPSPSGFLGGEMLDQNTTTVLTTLITVVGTLGGVVLGVILTYPGVEMAIMRPISSWWFSDLCSIGL